MWNEWAQGIGATGGGFSVLVDQPFVPDISYSAAVLHGLLTYLDIVVRLAG